MGLFIGKHMNETVKILSLGGLDEEGKNCLVVDIDGSLYVIECGSREPDRRMPGVDYVIPNFDWLRENKDRVKAYFILHGHVDELGALPYVYHDVPAPVYLSEVSKAMLLSFAERSKAIDPKEFDLRVVAPTSTFMVDGRKVSFYRTSHNIANSSGIAISTSRGNVVYTSDYVIENNCDKNFLTDLNALARLAEEKTLVLLTESLYAGRKGYTAPLYKLTPHIEEAMKNAKGRFYLAIASSNFYNITEAVGLALALGKKIVPYDQETAFIIRAMQSSGQLLIPRDSYAPSEDINRLRSLDVFCLMLANKRKLFGKIALLAAGQNEGTQARLAPEDTFAVGTLSDDNNELEATDALDALYRSGATIVTLPRKGFLRMHASEEDLKTVIALLKPKYYVPAKGLFKDMLANAEIALSMGLGLTHNSVFLLENGTSLIIDDTGARLFSEGVKVGDVYIDGIGVGDVQSSVIADRERLSQGVVLMAVTVSKATRKIVAGPDVQLRGLVFLKDSEAMVKEVSRHFLSEVEDGLKAGYKLEDIKQKAYDRVNRMIRRTTGKEPLVLPLIVEAN